MAHPQPTPGSKRPRLALLALTALALTAACGGAASGSGVASLGSTTTTKPSGNASTGGPAKFNRDDALKFSQCMRTHGVPNFPDPTISAGGASIRLSGGPDSGLDPNSPQFQAAQSACKHLMPNGGQPSPQQQAQAKDAALHFAQCMRAHGVNVPDPQVSTNGGGVKIQIGSGGPGQGIDQNSPQFQAAQSACQHFLPGNRSGPSPSPGASGSGSVSGSAP
jgi:hypothetical protein